MRHPVSSTSVSSLHSIRNALLPPSLSSSALMNSAESALAALGNVPNLPPSIEAENKESCALIKWSSSASRKRVSSHTNKMLLAQVARLQTELQMQAVKHQTVVAEFRRRLAYVSARQTHTPKAAERFHLISMPGGDTSIGTGSDCNADFGTAVSRKLGFSILPDGTGLGGAIVTSVISGSIAFKCGLHIFDRITKIESTDICQPEVTFTQIVDLLKVGGNNKSLSIEVARFEEPGNENEHLKSESKENCQPRSQSTVEKTVASVAVQTLPCLNPWFLADVRTSSSAVRTLRNAGLSNNKVQVKTQIRKPSPPTPPPRKESLQPLLADEAETPILNFVPPAKMDYSGVCQTEIISTETEEYRPKCSSSSDDSAIRSDEPATTTTLSSNNTWATNSSSTSISLPHSAQSLPPENNESPLMEEEKAQINSDELQPPVTTMYTNSQHLAHTIRIQQHLFMQAQSSRSKLDSESEDVEHEESHIPDTPGLGFPEDDRAKRRLSSLSYVSCTSSPLATPSISRRQLKSAEFPADDALSWNDASNSTSGRTEITRGISSADSSAGYRWVVKVKSDGTRRIVRRPLNEASESASPDHEQNKEKRGGKNRHHSKKGKHRRDKESSTPSSKHNKRQSETVLAVTTV